MADVRKYSPGEFCWTDLGTTNVVRAKKFYRSLFGSKMTDFPMGEGDAKYSILSVDGKDTSGLYAMAAEQKKAKPVWLPYISVKNVSETAKKAKAAGGKICSPPVDVGDRGRMAVLQDPTGATFAVWQPGKRKGAELKDKPGTVCWHDLNTPKTVPAGKFYAKVFGWKTTDKKYSGNDYHLFKLGRKDVCGMWPWPLKKLPPSWVTYWQVADCAKSVAKVKRLGGRIIMGTTPVPGMARFAIVRDPQGASFGILEPEKQAFRA